MGIAALGPKPNTTRPAPGHKIYPYLLRNLKIERPNHVWAADIAYLPIGRDFLYLVAIIDWASRAIQLVGGQRHGALSLGAVTAKAIAHLDLNHMKKSTVKITV
jgi:hypothetical protein